MLAVFNAYTNSSDAATRGVLEKKPFLKRAVSQKKSVVFLIKILLS